MSLKHRYTKIEFIDEKTSEHWEVMYMPEEYLTPVEVLLDGKLFHSYKHIPGPAVRAAKHPNKTQALAIIRLVKKEA